MGRLDHGHLNVPAAALAPAPPRSLADTRLPEALVVDIILRRLARVGELRAADLAGQLGVALSVIEPVLAGLRAQGLLVVPRRGSFDADVCYALSQAGRQQATEAGARGQYAGSLPVALSDYVRQVRRQATRGLAIDRQAVRRALGDAVVSEALLTRLGTALNSGRSIYLYGPSGAGKTFLAQRLARTAIGTIRVPRALYVEGEIIQFFDPLVHVPVEQLAPAGLLDRQAAVDRRWVETRRPVVATGGELTLAALDLEPGRSAHGLQAPPQLKANNGVLIVDDLGRQRVPVRELMNRWIVPLDRGVDFMTLPTGASFELPFDVTVIFSSNLTPAAIVDPALLRRLAYKIPVGALDEEGYRRVVRQACARAGFEHSEFAADFLIRVLHAEYDLALYATIPYDVIGKLRDRALFLGEPARLDAESLRWAWDLYLAPDGGPDGARSLDDLR